MDYVDDRMNGEIVADFATLIIFLMLAVYIQKKRVALQISTPLIIFIIGIVIISISDIIAIAAADPFVECIAGKFTITGSLISIVALLHTLSVFPKKSQIYKFLPTAYIVSGLLIISLFLTPHLLYCDPIEGGTRGIFWDIFLIWTYSLLTIDSFIPGIRYFTLKINVQRMQELLIFIGTIVAFIYVGVAQVIPHFVEGFNYHTSIFALPIMGIFYVYSSVRYGMFVYMPRVETKYKKGCDIKIGQGKIIAISNIPSAFKVFRSLVADKPGMVISLKPPNYIRENYDLEKTPIVWITYFPQGYKPSIKPGRLHFEGMETVINFARNGGKILLFEGVEYFIANLGRKFIVEFVESLRRINDSIRIILAVQNIDTVKGFADETYDVSCNIKNPQIIMTMRCPSKNVFLITNRQNKCVSCKNVLRINNDFSADRLIFEGIKKVEDSSLKTVCIDCMDYIISTVNEKNAANFLKDAVDITVYRGGKVYIRYSPLIEKSPLLLSLVDSVE